MYFVPTNAYLRKNVPAEETDVRGRWSDAGLHRKCEQKFEFWHCAWLEAKIGKELLLTTAFQNGSCFYCLFPG